MQSKFAALAAGIMSLVLVFSVQAQERIDTLFERLRTADAESAVQIEIEITRIWSDSGSAAGNLLLQRGRRSIARNDMVAAIADLSALVDLMPEFAEGWNARATAYFLIGDHGRSVSDIRQVLPRNPRHFGAIHGLAMIFEAAGDYRSALEAYERVLELSPQRRGAMDAARRMRELLARQQI